MVSFRVFALFSLVAVTPAAAQSDTTTYHKRPSPLSFFFKSFALPGWGQAELDRKLTGGLFMAVEGVSLGMGVKAHYETNFLRSTGSARLKDKQAEQQDWFFLMAVNHLLSGMEAFVSASLFDFPGDVKVQKLDNGKTGIGVTLPIGRPR